MVRDIRKNSKYYWRLVASLAGDLGMVEEAFYRHYYSKSICKNNGQFTCGKIMALKDKNALYLATK